MLRPRRRPPTAARTGPRRRWWLGGLLAPVAALAAPAGPDPTQLSLEQLLALPVVAASKYAQPQAEVAAAVSVITREDIRTFGWRTLAQALASLPGFQLTDDHQYSYTGARGLALPDDYNTRLLITVNGQRLNEPVYDSMLAGHEFPLDLDLVERIEVIPGPGGAVHGQNALFGVINVVTRRGAALDGLELATSAEPTERGQRLRASWGRQLNNGMDLLLSGSALRARGEDAFHDYGDGGSGVAAGLDGERDDELFVHMAQGRWSFDLVHGDRRKDDPTAASFTDPLTKGQYIRDRYLSTQLRYEDPAGSGPQQWMLRLSLGQYRYDSVSYWGGVGLRATAASTARGAELRWLHTGWADHKFMLGLELQDSPRQDQVSYGEVPADDIYLLTRGWRAGVYAQDEWRLSGSLVATLGLRVDRNNVNGTQRSPRAALIWQAQPVTTVKLLAGRAHRSPNVYEQDWDWRLGRYPVPLPAIAGETIDTAEWVIDHRPRPDTSLRAALYHWTLHRPVVWDSDQWLFVSGPRIQARGVELSADRIFSGGARLRGSLSLQDAETADGTRLVNAPRWMGKLHLSAPLAGGARAGLEWLAESRRRTVDGGHVPGLALTHLHLSTDRLWPGVQVSLGVRNLFDKRYRQPVGPDNWTTAVAQTGRSWSLKLEARF